METAGNLRHRVGLVIAGITVSTALWAQQPPTDPSQAIWIDVPHYRQPEEGCGAASLAMVIDYWRQQKPEDLRIAYRPELEQIHQRLYNPGRRGVPAADMAPFLESYGFDAFVFFANWDDLKGHIEQGRPVIVAYRSSASTFHYAVAAGIEPEFLSLNDPAGRKLTKIPRAEFERAWAATNRWSLLALPAQTHSAPPEIQQPPAVERVPGGPTPVAPTQ